jgi:hypothetical protein
VYFKAIDWYREELDLNYFKDYVQTRLQIYSKGFQLTKDDSVMYYKLRHNLFLSFVCFSLGLDVTSDVSLRDYGIDSDKTPDLFFRLNDSYCLIEVSVVNKKDTGHQVKDFYTKYDFIKLKTDIPLYDFYVILSLDDSQDDVKAEIYQLSNLLKKPLLEDFEETFLDIKSSIISIQNYLLEACPELLESQDVDSNVELNALPYNVEHGFTDEIILSTKTSHINLKIQRMIKTESRKLVRFLKPLPNINVKLIVNMNRGFVSYVEDETGFPKNTLFNYLRTNMHIPLEAVIVKGSGIDHDILSIPEPTIISDNELSENGFNSQVTTYNTQGYLNSFWQKMMRLDNLDFKEMKLLSTLKLEPQQENFSKIYTENYLKLKNESLIVIENKNPFIFPIIYNLTINESPDIDLEISELPITNMILKRSKKYTNFNKFIDKPVVDEEIIKATNKLSTSIKSLRLQGLQNEYRNWKYKRLELDDKVKLELFQTHFKLSDDLSKLTSESGRQEYKNRVLIPKSEMKKSWDSVEMNHFQRQKNVHRIVDEKIFTFDFCDDMFMSILNSLFEFADYKVSDYPLGLTNPVGKKLATFTQEMLEQIRECQDYFMRTKLAHSLLFISRLCYSLMYLSNIKLNSNDFIYDNLGYKECLLIVKGGKKIRSSRNSRLFKLIVKVEGPFKKLLECCNVPLKRNEKNEIFAVFNWKMLRIGYLKKGYESYQNIACHLMSKMSDLKIEFDDLKPYFSIKILSFFSQKRKLEVWLSSLRYLLFNSMGTHTDLNDFLKGAPILNYDPLICYFQNLVIKRYNCICNKLKEGQVIDLMTLKPLFNMESLSEKFEEHIFMSKAPFNPYNEHLNNLKNVLTVDYEFFEKYQTREPLQILKLTDKKHKELKVLFEDDFYFDSKMAFIIGEFCGKYINNTCPKIELAEKFNNIVNKTYTQVKTSSGMRSDDAEFFGKKGHDVVFGQFDQAVLDDMLNIPETPSEFRKLLLKHEISLKMKIEDIKEPKFYLDMKDKQQYKGSREIYVLTMFTKICQQPLEQFFKILSKVLPNEIISIPSSSRSKYIHGKLFENSNTSENTMFCTLDCRKWAPKSNLWKYWFFIDGMSPFLPSSFVRYFKSFMSLYMNKKIKIQGKFVNSLKENPKTSHLVKHLVQDGENFDLHMPYSFMMGIFNYLSSLFHAASQLFFTELMTTRMNINYNMCAHSDDSSGVVSGGHYNKLVESFSYYEVFQKSVNHLLSKKKSVLGKSIFEMISIMYMDKNLLPMVHKFLTISFEPKGKGYLDDISSVVSTVVSSYNNGASLIQSYVAMLCHSELIRKSYHIPNSTELSRIPLYFGGVFNMHPLHLMMLGSSSQEIMLDFIENEKDRSLRIQCASLFSDSYIIGYGINPSYQTPYYKQHTNILEVKDDDVNLIKNLPLICKGTTLSDVVQYQANLRDIDFVYSLTGVDTNQILLSTLFYKNMIVGNNIKTNIKKIANLYLQQKVGLEFDLISDIQVVNMEYSHYSNYLKAAENVTFKLEKFDIVSDKKCKPMTYSTLELLGFKFNRDMLEKLMALENEPRLEKIIPDSERVNAWRIYLESALGPSFKNNAKSLIKYLNKDVESIRNCYNYFPANVNIDRIERFWSYSILYTTYSKLISNQQPQLFTLSKINKFLFMNDHLKHQSLVTTLMKNYLDGNSIDRLISNYNKCKSCYDMGDRSSYLNDIKKFYLSDNNSIQTKHPFIVYLSDQHQKGGVWYGQCDFDVYISDSKIEHRLVDGTIYTRWYTSDSSYINFMFNLYKIICDTRGLAISDIVYDKTGYQHRVGFSSYLQAYITNPFERAMYLTNSQYIMTDVISPTILRKQNKFNVYGNSVDFNIYQIYDFNEEFYIEHGLKEVKDLTYRENTIIDLKELKENFPSTKIYKILTQNDSLNQTKNLAESFINNGLLGSQDSFTKSLYLADKNKVTSYSYQTNFKFDAEPLAFKTISSTPILDLVNHASLNRLNLKERDIIFKASDLQDLSIVEISILKRIIEKLGLNPVASSIILYKQIFTTMSAGDVCNLPKQFIITVISVWINTIYKCLGSMPRTSHKVNFLHCNLDANNFSQHAYLCIKHKYKRGLIKLLTSALIECNVYNPSIFWSEIKENMWTSCLRYNKEFSVNLHSFILGILTEVSFDELQELFQTSGRYVRSQRFSEDLEDNDLDDADAVYSIPKLQYGIPDFIYNEDGIDIIAGNDDIVDYLNEDRDEEVFHERSWQGETLTFYNKKSNDEKAICEYYLTHDMKEMVVYSVGMPFLLGWKHECEIGLEKIGNFTYYKTLFKKDIQTKNINVFEKEITFRTGRQYYEMIPTEPTNEEMSLREKVKLRLKDSNILGEELLNFYLWSMPDLAKILDNFFKKIDQTFIQDIKEKRRQQRKRALALPGFAINTKDDKLKAELNAIFKNNYVKVLNGTVNLTKNMYQSLEMRLKSLFKPSKSDKKCILLFFMSLMPDVNISENVDIWFLDTITGYLNEVELEIQGSLENITFNLLNYANNNEQELNYQVEDPYEGL